MHNSCPAWNSLDPSTVGFVEDQGSVLGMNIFVGDLPENLFLSHPGSLSDSILDFF